MNFSEELSKYMELLKCTAKDICNKTNLSPALVSRYLNNKRTPKANSKYVEQLASALSQIATEKNIELTMQEIQNNLNSGLNYTSADYNTLADNLNILLDKLKISTIDLSKSIGYDPSFISRIKNKERRPADVDNFIKALSDYIENLYSDDNSKDIILSLFSCKSSQIETHEAFEKNFFDWIRTPSTENNEQSIASFLNKLDDFKLEDYISKDFSKIKVPTSPVILKNSRAFFGAEGRKKAESEFMKTTLISKSKESIFYYNNLPIATAAEDENFKNKFVLAITMLLKKGLHLNIVHNVDRPLNEMLLGLENWIPVYMTGSISPYYFDNPPSNMFLGSHCVSGSVALYGECVKQKESTSMFYVTTKKEELSYAKEKAKFLLSKAKPLMKIYKEKDEEDFKKFMALTDNKKSIELKKDIYKNIDFSINDNNWIMINKNNNPKMHFVIYNKKLMQAVKSFLEQN
ncbi:MAG: helix-turn-helix transcriptional regulator [Clostridia bacterium]|nr:helix-turn-helix transcriptional regulator [Clostridia bacterium]